MKLRLVVPGRIDQATGGYRYAAAMLAAWRAAGHDVDVSELSGRFPDADPVARKAARDCLATRGMRRLVIDGLALPAFDAINLPHDALALIHHPLGLETGLDQRTACRLLAEEAARLATFARIIVTSTPTIGDLVRMGVAPAKITAVDPGTESAYTPLMRRGTPIILCVATVTPRKDHHSLLRALHLVRKDRWRALFVGSAQRDPLCVARVRAEIRRLRLGRRVRLVGEVERDQLDIFYRHAHIFALPSRHEGYGMAFAEALARRLPVIGVKAGAVPAVVPPCAGILSRAGDIRSLARALRCMLGPPRKRYARNAATLRFPDWKTQAARLWALAS